jgi:hypothetical protein
MGLFFFAAADLCPTAAFDFVEDLVPDFAADEDACAADLLAAFFLGASAASPGPLCFSGEFDSEEAAAWWGTRATLRAPTGKAHTIASAATHHHLRPN